MRKKSILLFALVLPLLAVFYVGEYVTGSFHFIVKCDPPKKLYCEGVDFAGRDLRGSDLHKGQFQKANLIGADLYGADLRKANFDYANLAGANLSTADLSGASLIGADLTGANLLSADLSGATLNFAIIQNADLANVILKDATLEETDLTGAKLTLKGLLGAKLLNTLMPDGAIKTNQFPNSANYNQNLPPATTETSNRSAVSLSCRDGMVLAYCQVYWSNGRITPLPMGVGQRQGGVVDAIVYYDLQRNPSCILLYADGSIMTSYDTSKC